VLTAEKARDVLDSIPIMRNTGRGGKVNQKCNADSWWLLSSEYSE
jgi:hypothetical protein